MKSFPCKIRVQAAAALAIFAAVILMAHAQSDSANRPPRRAFPRAGLRQYDQGIARILNALTDEQRDSLRQAMRDLRDSTGDLEQQLHAARVAVFEATLAPKFDEALIRQKAEALARLEADLTVLRAKALSQMRPKLTPDQIEEIEGGRPGADDAGAPLPSTKKRPDIPRDANGLPLKDAPAAPR